MKDETEQILEQWKRPEPSADLAARIIAQAEPRQVSRSHPLARLALVASLVLAVIVAWPRTQQDVPAPVAMHQPQYQDYTVDGIPILADVDFADDEDEFALLDDQEWISQEEIGL